MPQITIIVCIFQSYILLYTLGVPYISLFTHVILRGGGYAYLGLSP